MKVNFYEVMVKENQVPYLAAKKVLSYDGRKFLNTPKEIADFVMNKLCTQYYAEEYVHMLAFNTASRLLGVFEIAHGSADTCYASTREVFQRALLCGATNIIMTHNHPTGDPSPSQADVAFTQTIKKAGDLMCIRLNDHIIVGRDGWYSFHESMPETLC